MGFGWFMKDKLESSKYGKHYCQKCGGYAKETEHEGESITRFCYHCGAEMEFVETPTGAVDISVYTSKKESL